MFSTEFFLTSLIVVLIPGTGVIYTLSTGLFVGKKESIFAALGCTSGIIPHLVASVLGLSALLHTSAVAFSIVKYIGVAYLLYLAYSMWKDTSTLQIDANTQKTNLLKIVTKGFLINILNPKLSIFFLAFLPQFVSPHASSPMTEMFFLSFSFMFMTFVIFVFYGLFANKARVYVINSPKIMSRIQKTFAAIFVLFSAKLAMAER
ncbi:LysE family translocator [Sulfurospirillum arcachonense]|uniref:LysE family translocator n=1 Tax=Sulfurospirillum arcachonense TaxID=57666 RepID=UPI000469977A|nr:LysE family translocator [Sulfurospirillum arcachonense]